MPAPLVGKNIMNIKENKESVYLKDFCSNKKRYWTTCSESA